MLGSDGSKDQVVPSGVFVPEENLLEGAAAVGGTEDPPLLVGSVGVAQDADEEAVRIGRIHDNVGDHLAIPESQVLVHVAPASVDLYMPSPVERSGRMIPPPLPT